jgi:hypothetical protein
MAGPADPPTSPDIDIAAAPPRSLAARLPRLVVWVVLCVTLSLGQIAWLISLRGERTRHADRTLILGQVILGAAVVGIAILLATTPADALRLPRRLGVGIILTVTALLQAAAILAQGAPLRAMYGACVVGLTAAVLAMLLRRGISPWWAVLIGWNPLLTIH